MKLNKTLYVIEMGIMRAKKYEWFIYESRPRAQVKDGREGLCYTLFSHAFLNLTHHLRQKCIFNVKQLDMVE